MLSSVANRFYWTGRYLERAENTARLLNVYTQLLLDLPPEAGVTMRHLVRISGAEALFDAKRRWPPETSVVRFMTTDTENPGCILSTLAGARENLRTLRDIVPTEAFRAANELYLNAGRKLGRTAIRRLRVGVLQEVIDQCQQLTGLFEGTMSHGDGYSFLGLGRNLERADMTTRIVDVAGELLSIGDAPRIAPEHETILWVNVLRSLSAYQSYRQSVKSRIAPVRVLHFVVNDRNFPRALAHCLNEIDEAAGRLPNPEAVRAAVRAMNQLIESISLRELAGTLHDQIDRFQVALANIHESIDSTWFRHDDGALTQSSTQAQSAGTQTQAARNAARSVEITSP
jgi:uncharacterized alpha-E superfamily protein